MSSELERLKTTCIAQEAEIARLQSGFDELMKFIDENRDQIYEYEGYFSDDVVDADLLIDEINRITGVEK